MSQQDVMTALANEARRNEAKQRIARFASAADTAAAIVQCATSINNDALLSLESARAELATLEVGAGPGITANFGAKSSVTQLLDAEREAAKGAVIDFVKANPACSEAESAAAWDAAALASHPTVPVVLQDSMAMSHLYRLNLLGLQLISEDSWPEQRAWILSTPKDTILSM